MTVLENQTFAGYLLPFHWKYTVSLTNQRRFLVDHMLKFIGKCLMASCYFWHCSNRSSIYIIAKWHLLAATLHILCMDLPITTTTIADEWLNNLIFPDNNKCIMVNGHVIINVGAWQLFSSHKEFWKVPINSNICIWLRQCHWNNVFHNVHVRKWTCFYVGNP